MPVVSTSLAVVGGAAAAGAGAAAVKTGFWAAVGAGIVKGWKAVTGFVSKNGERIGRGVAVGSSVLSNSSFEGKNKKVTFQGNTPARLGGYAFNIPSIQVSKLDKKDRSGNYSRASNGAFVAKRPSYYQKPDNSSLRTPGFAPAPYRNKYPTRKDSSYKISHRSSR